MTSGRPQEWTSDSDRCDVDWTESREGTGQDRSDGYGYLLSRFAIETKEKKTKAQKERQEERHR